VVLGIVGLLGWQVRADQLDQQWGGRSGNAPFAFAFIGDMPYGTAQEARFARVIQEINGDPAVDFVMHAGDIKAGSERCDNSLVVRRFAQYEQFRRPFVFTPGDNEWTDCHRANNGAFYPLERLAFLRSTFFPSPGFTTGGQVRRVRSQAESGAYPEFVENVLFHKHSVLFATLHVVGSNNNLEPWSGIDPADSFLTPRADRLAEFQRRQEATLAWLDEIFGSEAAGTRAIFVMIQANPNFNLPPTDQQRAGFNEFLSHLALRAQQYGRPVLLAHGDNHVFFQDKPLPNLLFSRMQTFGSDQVHWVKVHVDPRSSGVFGIEQKVVFANVN
jgi:hypothetical protein